MKLGEAVYKSQQAKKDTADEKDGNDKEDKKEDVVDADFEDVKEDKEKSYKDINKGTILVSKETITRS